MHPPEDECRPRPLGSYDPTELLVIPYADLIAALNATTVLTQMLQDTHTPVGEHHTQLARIHLSYAVAPDSTPTDTLPSREAAADYARSLRDRLRSYLPRPAPGQWQ